MAVASATTPSIFINSLLHSPSPINQHPFFFTTPTTSPHSQHSISTSTLHHHHHIITSLPHNKRTSVPGSSFLSSWVANAHLGSLPFAWLQRGVFSVKKEKSSCWGGTLVQASFLGVGAPEVLVIAVVALLVFGPKGLAEVARTLGKSLRAFQPTIRELQEVSRDFRLTLEKEIGLDELQSGDSRAPTSVFTVNEQPRASFKSNVSTVDQTISADNYSKATEGQLNSEASVSEEQRQAAAAAAWGGSPPAMLNGEIMNNDITSRQDKVQNGPMAGN